MIFEYREVGSADGTAAGVMAPPTTSAIITVPPGAQYEAAVSYRVRGVTGEPLVLKPVMSGSIGVVRGVHTLVTQTVAYPLTSDASSITVAEFRAVLDDGRGIDFPAATISGLAGGTAYLVTYSLSAGTYAATPAPALAAMASSDNAYLGTQSTANADGSYPAGETAPDGYVGDGRTVSKTGEPM